MRKLLKILVPGKTGMLNSESVMRWPRWIQAQEVLQVVVTQSRQIVKSLMQDNRLRKSLQNAARC